MLLSGRDLNGGIAHVGDLCDSYAYSVCSEITLWVPYPLENHDDENWDIFECEHELGHNFGSLHRAR